MIHALILEVHKLRRLGMIQFVALLVLGVSGLTAIGIWIPELQLIPHHSVTQDWAALLYNYSFITVMISPWAISVLSSKQIEIEHDANGWNFTRSVGLSRLNLCFAKMMMVTALIAIALIAQTIAVLIVGLIAGLEGDIGLIHWSLYTFYLIILNMAFVGLHIYLSTATENQLISVGVGVLGSFISIYWFLQPSPYALLMPWGYYASISHVRVVDHEAVFIHPNLWIPIIAVLVMAVIECLAILRLSRRVR